MKLKKFSYKEYSDTKREWELKEFELGNINLMVGSNASGKTRILNVISGLSRLLLHPKLQYNSGTYSACFEKGSKEIKYSVQYENGLVMSEELSRDDQNLFTRNQDGEGSIFNTQLKKHVKFKIPVIELVALRRDEFQYPYLEDLFLWAHNSRHFRFSKEQEKQTLSIINANKASTEGANMLETNQAIEIFRKAQGLFRDDYVKKVIADFNSIGYNISNVDTGALHSIKVDSPIGNKVRGLRVFEIDRNALTDQNEMSDGMFRALSIIIHYNYYSLIKKPLNILIDDIGEGLDFDRSTKLITLLIEKSINSDMQLIMSTNDKFVMNNTNLDFWQIVSRKGNLVELCNKFNSAEKFKQFKFTGLNNFDFFTSDFFETGFN